MGVDWEKKIQEFRNNGFVMVRSSEVLEFSQEYLEELMELDKFIEEYGFKDNAKREDWGWSECGNIDKKCWEGTNFSGSVGGVLKIFQEIAQKVSILDKGKNFSEIGGVQLTFRHRGNRPARYNAHLDGGGNYREKEDSTIKRHSVIGGILLSKIDKAESGATVFWKGSHYKIKEIADKINKIGYKDPRVLKYGIKEFLDKDFKLDGSIELTPILGDFGDMFFFHFSLLHGTAENTTDVVRKCLFHRFKIGEEKTYGSGDDLKLYQNLFWWDEKMGS